MRRRHCPLAPRPGLALVLGLGALIAGLPSHPAAALSHPSNLDQRPPSAYLRPFQPCPANVQILVHQLLGDLPSYANRVASRNLDLSRRPLDPITTVLVVSSPDFTPIELAELAAPGPGQADDAALEQVFFTTLERQYRQNRVVSLQHHHWLFLAQTPEGWRLALLYSSLGTLPENRATGRPPTPPQESSDGIVGQAVRLWLRDCRAGAVFPAPAETVPPDTPSRDAPLDPPTDGPESMPLEPEPNSENNSDTRP